MDQEEIADLLGKHNDKYCDPPLSTEEIERIAESVARYPAKDTRKTDQQITAGDLLQFNHTDSGASELLEFCYRGRIKFNHQTGKWLLWENDKWVEDKSGKMIQLCIDVARLL